MREPERKARACLRLRQGSSPHGRDARLGGSGSYAVAFFGISLVMPLAFLSALASDGGRVEPGRRMAGRKTTQRFSDGSQGSCYEYDTSSLRLVR